MTPLSYHGERVPIFPYYTGKVAAQQQSFNSVRKQLIDAGAKCSLQFPAKLQAGHNNTVSTFISPAKAKWFAGLLALFEWKWGMQAGVCFCVFVCCQFTASDVSVFTLCVQVA